MMRRFTIAFVLTTMLLLGARSAHAGWHEFWDTVKLGWHRNNAWPEPFQYADRQSVRAAYVPMTASGWQNQTTLTSDQFDAETQELTRGGQMKLRWIVSDAPAARRTIFVQRGVDEHATAVRVDQVQQAITQMIPDGPLPQVVQTNSGPRDMSGRYTDQMWKAFESEMPAPILPDAGGLNTSTGN